MYEQYATSAQLSAYLSRDIALLPADHARLLKRASEQIFSLVKMNYNSLRVDHVLAVQYATCAQVEFFIEAGETTNIIGNITSMGSGKTSISVDPASIKRLCSRSISYLNDVGLLYRGISSSRLQQQV